MRPVLAGLLGVLATAGFPPYGYYPLIALALLGLLALWYEATPRRAALYGFLFGLGHYLSGIYWVFISTHLFGGAPLWMGILLTFLLSSYAAVHIALAGFLLSWRRLPWPAAWALLQVPLIWLLAELLRDWHLVWSFPWLSLGYALIDAPLAPLAPLIGIHGLSAVLCLLAGTLWLLWRGSLPARLTAVTVAGLLAVMLWLIPSPGNWTTPQGEPLTVGIVQGNIPQERKWLPSERLPTMQLYRGLSQELMREHPQTRLIIWPEAAIPMLYEEVRGNYVYDLREWAYANQITLLFGILNREPDGLYNSVRSAGLDQGLYRKRHLVPFGEFFPVPDFMRRFMQGINLDYENLSHGALEQPLIRIGDVAIGMSICFEDVFGRDIRRDLPAAGILVNVTNDAWFANSSAPYQHLQIARMRALETGRELIRVSNRGVSGRIDTAGRLREQTAMFATTTLTMQVQPYQGETPYARFGDRPLWTLTALMLLLMLLVGRRGAG